MPYIKSGDGRREILQRGEQALSAGELNYQIFYYIKHLSGKYDKTIEIIVKDFVKQFLGENPNYQKYNDMTGALIRCCIELERRLKINADILIDIAASYNDEIAKYEDLKCFQNGDVE
jgi:hypothetical protein